MISKLLQYYVRHFPIDRGKNRVISLLWKPLSKGRKQAHETVLRQADVKMKCLLDQMIQRQLYFWGSYEAEYCAHWMRIARESHTIFDVGANVGLYALLAAKTNPSAKIHAFEPTPAVLELLRANIALNNLGNIKVNSTAVGKICGEAVLRQCRGSDGANEGMNYIHKDCSESEHSDQPVKIVSIDEYCKTNGIERIDLMKMDIEGGEYDALLGAQTLLESQSIDCLFIEFMEWAANRSGSSTEDIRRLLQDMGYRLCVTREGKLIELESGKTPQADNVIALSSAFTGRLPELRIDLQASN